jgi:hypothetical protein
LVLEVVNLPAKRKFGPIQTEKLTQTISFVLATETLVAIDQECLRRNIPRSILIRESIVEKLQTRQQEEK